MDDHDKLLEELKSLCLIAPHWQQLLLQGFWYGLMSWLVTCAEDNTTPDKYPMTLKEMVSHADPEFASWPLEWLQVYVDKMLTLNPVLHSVKLNDFFERLDTMFQDTIPTDLDIFSTLVRGEHLTEEQWVRLHDALAPMPPPPPPTSQSPPLLQHQPPSLPPSTPLQLQPQPHTIRNNHRTRRLRGKRAITPLKRKRAVTHHHKHSVNVNVIKQL
jgi:hypothetical protein